MVVPALEVVVKRPSRHKGRAFQASGLHALGPTHALAEKMGHLVARSADGP